MNARSEPSAEPTPGNFGLSGTFRFVPSEPEPEPEPELRDHRFVVVFFRAAEVNVISGVLAELANIRTPAALLGGAALGTMFVQLKPGRNKRLGLIYTMLSTSAFSLQLVCVLCSTVRTGV